MQHENTVPEPPPICKIGDVIKHTIFINLDSRVDRRNLFEKQITELHSLYPNDYTFQTVQRFSAIKDDQNGALGCSKSHAECIRIAKAKNWEYVFICEDDAEFIHPEVMIHQLNLFLSKYKNEWDVILLSGNNYAPYKIEGPECFRIANCNCCTSYIIRREYYDKLLNNFEDGIALFTYNPQDKPKYACDIYWKKLQNIDRWYLITPICISQRPDYSDIEKRFVNYNNMILNLVKKTINKKGLHTKP